MEDSKRKHFANYENSKMMYNLDFYDEVFLVYWVKYDDEPNPKIFHWGPERPRKGYLRSSWKIAPLWQQVVEWLDSKFGIAFVINFDSDMDAILHDILEQLLIKKNGKLK